MTVINTNTAAMRAQNASRAADLGKEKAMQQLSTGKRINSARDDAAGLAIATKMTTQIRSLDMARRNIADGISLAQTAEGALGEVTNILQRMRELAVQASSGTMGLSDRAALQTELDQSVKQIDHILKNAQFNGVVLFSDTRGALPAKDNNNDGDFLDVPSPINDWYGAGAAAIAVQTGGSAGDTIDISIPTLFSDVDGFTLLGDTVTLPNGRTRFAGLANIDLRAPVSHDTMPVEISPWIADPTNYVQYTSSPYKSYDDVAISAQDALAVIEGALNKLSETRANLGAVSNRLDSALGLVETNATNLTDARSRIEDADFSEASIALAKEQILSQAATSMLAQANTSKQDVLKLIS